MLYGVVVYEEQLTGSLPYEFDITWLHGSSPENRISCEMLPPTSKAHRGRVSFISPARKSSGSELSKELEKNSHWLCCPFFLYFPTLNCLLWLTPLGYTTDYSLSILATDEKHCLLQKKKKIPSSCMVACRVHTLHTLIIEVCVVSLIPMFTDKDGSLSEWIMLNQQCLLKLLFVLFQVRVFFPNQLILMLLFTINL